MTTLFLALLFILAAAAIVMVLVGILLALHRIAAEFADMNIIAGNVDRGLVAERNTDARLQG